MAHRLDPLALVMGIAFAFIWSSAFSSSRIIVLEAPPLTALAVRFAISGTIGVAIALLLGGSFNLTGSQWRATILFGICQNVIYLGFNFIAMQWIEASLAAIIASSLPLIVAFLNRLLANERLGLIGTTGLIAGFVGVALVMGGRLTGGSNLAGILLCVVAAIALAVATLTIRSGLVLALWDGVRLHDHLSRAAGNLAVVHARQPDRSDACILLSLPQPVLRRCGRRGAAR